MADGPAFFAALTWLYAVDDNGLHHAVATLEPAECARWIICGTCSPGGTGR